MFIDYDEIDFRYKDDYHNGVLQFTTRAFLDMRGPRSLPMLSAAEEENDGETDWS